MLKTAPIFSRPEFRVPKKSNVKIIFSLTAFSMHFERNRRCDL